MHEVSPDGQATGGALQVLDRGEQPHRHPVHGGLPDARELAGLRHAQQGPLAGDRQAGEFVEKQGPAIGGLEVPRTVSTALVKAPRPMAEQLADHHVGRQRPQLTSTIRPSRALQA
ncbi:MAG: hypothetical protein IPG75_16415 [Gemmatimonadetes bacterium]|nr:hypothetical protein [Gemmatimonadota bacterium]